MPKSFFLKDVDVIFSSNNNNSVGRSICSGKHNRHKPFLKCLKVENRLIIFLSIMLKHLVSICLKHKIQHALICTIDY